ncbi:MAG: 3-dehydroquinate synthase [Oscillospiraceae bacterium]|nr:3-dehydroquinate synthase [Oscillospiraceae bacterium]
MTTVTVSASKKYDVLIGEGLLKSAGRHIAAAAPAESAMIVSDDTVNAIYGDAVESSLTEAGYRTERFVFPHGEQSKCAGTYIALLNTLASLRFTRGDIIVALGGGVTGDLAGFAAATYMRGVRYVQIPTTLLAAVDSSVGGKTAIDLDAGKNLCGAFYQPELVLCDYKTLDTLPESVFRDGCAEVIKYGSIADKVLFDRLRQGVTGQLEYVISACVGIKRDIVNQDERDTGGRAVLNFGHTVGHAIEQCSRYAVSHGSAVAAGMVIAARASYRQGLCDRGVYEGILELVRLYGLPEGTDFSKDELLDVMLSDKKRSGSEISLIIPRQIGNAEIHKIPVSALEDFLSPGLEE